jgi:integrase/recombinase XerD
MFHVGANSNNHQNRAPAPKQSVIKLRIALRIGIYAITKGMPYVSQRLQAELANYLTTRHAKGADTPFFQTDHRLRFSPNGLCVWFHQLYKNVGISGGSSHSGRKFFITTLANKGIGVRILASLAGHRSIAVTQRYIDVNDEQKRNAVELI